MNVRKTDEFILDIERQYEWYSSHAGWSVADRYLSAVEATCTLLGHQPLLGPVVAFKHPRLSGWRFFVVLRPFHRHILFYELVSDALVMRRAMHGHRNLQLRLTES
jgi:plasmid stabilization system protein ParE